MPRKSNGRKRGLQWGVAKHKIRGKQEEISLEAALDEDGETKEKFLGVPTSKVYKTGNICFEIMFRACDRLYLIPFTRTDTGEYIELQGKELKIHRLVLLIGFGILVQKTHGTVHLLWTEDLKIESFMCLSLMLIYFVAFCISVGVLARPKETVDLLNAWPFILDCLKAITTKQIGPLDDVSTSLKIIVLLPVNQGIAFAAMLMSLIISTLPICLYPALKNMGVIPDGRLPTFAWQLIFAPLEWATYLPPILISPYSGGLLLIGVGVIKSYAKHIRAVTINNMAKREIIERLFVCMQLYDRIFTVWFRFMVVPTLFGVSVAVIVTLFVTIRYTELPLIFYIFFPYTGVTLMTVIFWICYDATLIVRDLEDVVGKLLSYEPRYLRTMSKAERTKILKRAKATRPPELPIGIFSQFSLALPINVWEEILNQILFLLSF